MPSQCLMHQQAVSFQNAFLQTNRRFVPSELRKAIYVQRGSADNQTVMGSERIREIITP